MSFKKENFWKYFSILILLIVFGFKIYIIFWQYKTNNLLVPPSPDLIAHVQMADNISAGKGLLFNHYPPLLHLIVSKTSALFHTTNLDVFTKLGPWWLIVVIPIFYLLVLSMFGWQAAFWATIIYILVSPAPLNNYINAQYADIFGYYIVSPFYLISLFSFMKDGKKWKLWIILLFFLLAIATHHLTTALLFIVTIVALIIYLLINIINKNKEETRKTLTVSYIFIFLLIIIFIAVSFFLKNLPEVVFNAIFHGNSLLGGNSIIWGGITDYKDLSSSVNQFLFYIGGAGLFLGLVAARKNSKLLFPITFLSSWIIVTWLLTRTIYSYLPPRILNCLYLPLSISAGLFATEILHLLQNKWQKYLFIIIFGYAIVINSVQLYVDPFLLPTGFADESWYHQVDQQKFDYITQNIPQNSNIVINYSNPILIYKLAHANYQVYPYNGDISLTDYLKQNSADYLFINTMPPNVNPDTYFEQFSNYAQATNLMNEYQILTNSLVKQFSDNSKLIKLQ